eukprot:COSAG01_NODE_2238_length_8089_cov_5.948936_9_plen_107_part_00
MQGIELSRMNTQHATQVLQKHAKNRPLSLVFVPAAEAAAAALSRQLESEQHSPRETEELVRASTPAAQHTAQQPARGGGGIPACSLPYCSLVWRAVRTTMDHVSGG